MLSSLTCYRIKAVDAIHLALPEGASRKSTVVVSTISSDGFIRLYDLAALPESFEEKTQLQPMADYDTKGTRLACLTLAEGDETTSLNGKRKREEDEDGDDVQLASDQEVDNGESESYNKTRPECPYHIKRWCPSCMKV